MLSSEHDPSLYSQSISQTITILDTFELESGTVLHQVPVAYKTFGTLNETKDNVIVICHAFSGSADVSEWWAPLMGPGNPFDDTKYFIFCGNTLGSPYGSCSPLSLNPETGLPYGPQFPLTSIRDDVQLHKRILDSLGVTLIAFVIGGSMGGMQVLEWGFFGPEYVQSLVPMATSARHSAWGISWGESQRQCIYADPKYQGGYYSLSDPPVQGLGAARMNALLTYRTRNSFESRFGRRGQIIDPSKVHNDGSQVGSHLKKDISKQETESVFSVYNAQSYLRYQGEKFVNRFDANCYVAITRKLDTHDISRGRGSFEEAIATLTQPTLVIGIESDGLFTREDQEELSRLPNATLEMISSGEGHDGFLLEVASIKSLLSQFMNLPSSFFKPNPNPPMDVLLW